MTHRTQITINNSQYELLKVISEKEHKSISKIIRELIDSNLVGKKTNKYSLSEICGIASGDGDIARNHDKWIYGV